MEGLSPDQRAALDAHLEKHPLKCPCCGSEKFAFLGTVRMSFLHWPNGKDGGGNTAFVVASCIPCGYTIQIGCARIAGFPVYK